MRTAIMSDLTINPTNTSSIANGPANQATPPQPGKTASGASSAPGAGSGDSVTLSPGAQVASTESGEHPVLSDSDAQSQAAKLRQQLSNASLSGTARQNQAIVALLRN